jgi:hypothetical protein
MKGKIMAKSMGKKGTICGPNTTHIENRGKHVQEDPTKKPSNFPHNNFKKFKRKDKKTATVLRGGKPSCTHCNNSGHD